MKPFCFILQHSKTIMQDLLNIVHNFCDPFLRNIKSIINILFTDKFELFPNKIRLVLCLQHIFQTFNKHFKTIYLSVEKKLSQQQ